MKNKYTGLTDSEVIHNQKLYGKNEIVYDNKNRLLNNILTLLKQPIFLLTIISTILYLILGEVIYAIIMGIISIIVLTSYIYQQMKMTKTIESLKKIRTNTSKVIRNNKAIIINNDEITIDDIIILNEGDKVSADAIILESYNLYADESILIKDNINVLKSYDLLNKDATLKSNYVYSGTLITKGSGIAKVTNIGNKTEYGKNNTNLSIIENDSILHKQINKQYKIFTIISIIILAIVGIISTINNNLTIGILSGITAALSIIPIVTSLTFTLLICRNVHKMAENNSIIKKTSTIDTLNKISCLCVDKLGIITENKMIVKEFYSSIDNRNALLCCALACDKNNNDLYEEAIYEYVSKNNIVVSNDYKLIKQYPFTKETKIMANIYEYNGELYIFIKGTLNGLFDICNLDVEEKYKLHNFQKQLFKKGLEVVAFASKKIDKVKDDIFEYNVNFNGILGLYNPPKANVNQAIEICKQLGIKTIMICEDKKEIATFIGKEIGISDNPNTLPGKELDKISDEELSNIVKDSGIFSRITQKHKWKILNTLKNNNEVVAFTGDSVIDSDILKSADIGISMNKIGTDISKEASDLIILDDNFTTIVNTINSVKKISQKSQKLIKYIRIINILLTIISVILVLFNYQILLLPIYIIIIKMILEIMCFVILRK